MLWRHRVDQILVRRKRPRTRSTCSTSTPAPPRGAGAPLLVGAPVAAGDPTPGEVFRPRHASASNRLRLDVEQVDADEQRPGAIDVHVRVVESGETNAPSRSIVRVPAPV